MGLTVMDMRFHKGAAGIGLGVITAYVVALAFGAAYRESEILDVVALLSLPPVILFSIYGGSEKRFVFCVSSLLLAALFFDLAPTIGVSRAGLSLVLMTITATAVPLVIDLVVVDMGRQIHIETTAARMAQLA